MTMLRPKRNARSLDGYYGVGRWAWVVRFGACAVESNLKSTTEKLGTDLVEMLGPRIRDTPIVRVEKAIEARAALLDVAAKGEYRRESMPGDRDRLLAYLDDHPDGFLVMVSAHAAVGRDRLILPKGVPSGEAR